MKSPALPATAPAPETPEVGERAAGTKDGISCATTAERQHHDLMEKGACCAGPFCLFIGLPARLPAVTLRQPQIRQVGLLRVS
jgi:hypothetical protein